MYRDILNDNLLSYHPTGQQPKHTAKITKKWLQDLSVNTFEGPARAQT